jgi:enoyl-CoA hydratase/carnithine racemase
VPESLGELRSRLGGFVPRPQLADYAKKYAEYIHLEREGGLLEFRIHHADGPAILSLAARDAWVQALLEVSNDPENEVIIITGTGDAWIGGIDPASFARVGDASSDVTYEHFYANTRKLLEHVLFNIEVPVIAAVNGPGIHTEFAVFSDITLATPTAEFVDAHFGVGIVPGDGMSLALQHFIGPKRAALALYLDQVIGANDAERLGLINEVLELEDLMPRAREIAATILKAPRVTRRLTHAIIQRPWRRLLLDDGGFDLAHELFGTSIVMKDSGATFVDDLKNRGDFDAEASAGQ